MQDCNFSQLHCCAVTHHALQVCHARHLMPPKAVPLQLWHFSTSFCHLSGTHHTLDAMPRFPCTTCSLPSLPSSVKLHSCRIRVLSTGASSARTVCRSELLRQIPVTHKHLQDTTQTKQTQHKDSCCTVDQVSDDNKAIQLQLIDRVWSALEKEHQYL